MATKSTTSKASSEFIIFKTEDEKISVDVRFEEETVWLTQEQMATLFERDRTVISKHIANIFSEGELVEKSNVQILHIANSDKPVKFYNLNVIISVGYRVKSLRGTQFRIWATKRLNEYIRKGFTMDDERLKTLAVAVIGKNAYNASETLGLRRKYFIVRCSIFLPQA